MNKITNFVLQNRMMTLFIGALLVTFGYFSYTKLPIDAFPDVSPSLVQVFTVTEGGQVNDP